MGGRLDVFFVCHSLPEHEFFPPWVAFRNSRESLCKIPRQSENPQTAPKREDADDLQSQASHSDVCVLKVPPMMILSGPFLTATSFPA